MQDKHHQPRFITRRRIIWAAVLGSIATLVAFAYAVIIPFLRSLSLKRAVFQIGYLSDFGMGVETRFLTKYRIYVVRNTERLFVIYARCTHLGCVPDWKANEAKFECPCHGSSFCLGSNFDSEGINCVGPAERPLDRARVELDRNGQIVVDPGILYEWPKGGRNEFNDPGAYIKA